MTNKISSDLLPFSFLMQKKGGATYEKQSLLHLK